MVIATDCLASTGYNPTPLIVFILAVLLASVGAFVWRRSLLRGAALLLVLLLSAGGLLVSAGQSAPTPAQAQVLAKCEGSAPAPVNTETPGAAPVITNDITTYDLSAPFTITATGDGPIDFYVYTFTYMQFTVTGLTLDPATGVMTPPADDVTRQAGCNESGPFGNTLDGVTFRVYAHNEFGESFADFTINDTVWCLRP